MPGTWSHLAARFVDVAAARPLDSDELAWVEGRLTDSERLAFVTQSRADQRHGHDAGRHVEAHGGSGIEVRAALLHDIGKRHARLGLLGRTWASLAIRLRLPLWARARIYRDHGPLAAVELERWGAETLVVDFARHHHGRRPRTIEPPVWQRLEDSDRVTVFHRKAGGHDQNRPMREPGTWRP
ncbi:MAG: hypothetical protein R6X29_11080 [Acidimicrobiia bacterium]